MALKVKILWSQVSIETYGMLSASAPTVSLDYASTGFAEALGHLGSVGKGHAAAILKDASGVVLLHSRNDLSNNAAGIILAVPGAFGVTETGVVSEEGVLHVYGFAAPATGVIEISVSGKLVGSPDTRFGGWASPDYTGTPNYTSLLSGSGMAKMIVPYEVFEV